MLAWIYDLLGLTSLDILHIQDLYKNDMLRIEYVST